MNDDGQLLQQYAHDQSQPAFAELVRRHVPMVYATARRELGDADLSQDVSQAVFWLLARRADRLNRTGNLAGWLFRATCYAAATARRTARRRQHHEHRAAQLRSAMHQQDIDQAWTDIEPRLNKALSRLHAKDREAIVLRYLEERSIREVAESMRSSELATRARLSRALAKLRKTLGGEQAVLSAAGLGTILATKAVEAVPAGLAESVVSAAGATGATAGGTVVAIAKGAMNMMAWAKLKVAGVVAVVLVAGGLSSAGVVGVALLGQVPDRSARAIAPAVERSVPKATDATAVGQAALDALSQSLDRVEDVSAVLQVTQTGTESLQYIQNRIRVFEIGRERGLVTEEQAEAELTSLRESLRQPRSLATKDPPVRWLLHRSGMFRAETDGPVPGRPVTVEAYDGRRRITYDAQRSRGAIYADMPRPSRNPLFALQAHGEQLLTEFFVVAVMNGTLRAVVGPNGTIEVTGRVPAVMGGTPTRHPPRYVRAWLDPLKGHMPVRLDQGVIASLDLHADAEVLQGSMRDIDVKEVAPGIWFPVGGTYEVHSTANQADPKKPVEQWPQVSFASTVRIQFVLEQVQVNRGLTEQDFAFAFPPGTTVSDQVNRTVSIGEPSP